MIRRLYLLLLLGLTLLGLGIYAFVYAAREDVPEEDPTRRIVTQVEDSLPAQVRAGTSRLLDEATERGIDCRWAFLIIFLLFYVQFFIRGRVRARKRKKRLTSQVKIFFLAILLATIMVAVVEWVSIYPTNQIHILGAVLDRGDGPTFRRNVYHYGLLLGVAHLVAYILFTWLVLGAGARRAKKRQKVIDAAGS